MTNFEKYKEDILRIATESHSNLAMKDGVIVACTRLDCNKCDFFDGVVSCGKNRFNWLYEDDGEEPDGCDSCKYEYKRENESPCTECCNNYTSKWKRRPKKTRQDEFLKIFPNASVTHSGLLGVKPCTFEGRSFIKQKCDSYATCLDCRREYWLQEVENEIQKVEW